MPVTPEQAAQQLRHASQLDQRTASFNPTWLVYVFLTAATSAFTLGFWYVQEAGGQLGPVLAVTLGWAVLGLLVTAVILLRNRHNRRGFSYRWSIMMLIWTLTWVLAPTPSDPVWVVVIALLYPGYAVIGILWELMAERS